VSEECIIISFDENSKLFFNILEKYNIKNTKIENEIYIHIEDADEYFKKVDHEFLLPEMYKFADLYGINPYELYENAGRDDFQTWLINNFGINMVIDLRYPVSFELFSNDSPPYTSYETYFTYSKEIVERLWLRNDALNEPVYDPIASIKWTEMPEKNPSIMFVLTVLQNYYQQETNKTVDRNIALVNNIIEDINQKFTNDQTIVLRSLKNGFIDYVNRFQSSQVTEVVQNHVLLLSLEKMIKPLEVNDL
jgi:hypothetical protein